MEPTREKYTAAVLRAALDIAIEDGVVRANHVAEDVVKLLTMYPSKHARAEQPPPPQRRARAHLFLVTPDTLVMTSGGLRR